MNEYMKQAAFDACLKNAQSDRMLNTHSHYQGFEAAHDILVPLLLEVLERGMVLHHTDDLIERIKQVTEG